MDLQQLKEIIHRYLAGQASAAELEWLDRWLGKAEKEAIETPDAGEYQLVKMQILERLRLQYALPGMAQVSGGGKIFWIQRHWTRIAASLTIAASAAATYFYRFPLLDVIDPIAQTTIHTSPYQIRNVVLPDSSVVVLNGDSEITYPERFRGATRQVHLTGEAFFDVKRDERKAFLIDAGALDVAVLGTSFTVTNVARQPEAKVVVKSGRVSVMPEGQPAAVLARGEGLVVDKSRHTQAKLDDVDVDIRWTAKRLVFKAVSLDKVFQAVGETFGVTVRLNDRAIASRLFTGAFEQRDELPDILKIIELSYRLKIEFNDDHTITVSKTE